MVRMALDGVVEVKKLSFDLRARELTVIHENSPNSVLSLLTPLGFGARIADSQELSEMEEALETPDASVVSESRVLKQLLAINGAMFVAEFGFGWLSDSTGLIADSLDMLADALVYGLGLFAVGKASVYKRRAARFSGYFQLLLATGVIIEVVRRFIWGSEPEAPFMILVSFIALVANVSCLLLLAKHRKGDVHMQASWIFSTNDVLANIGVIIAGVLVYFTRSPFPDLIIGAVIAAVVFRGALAILRISRPSTP